MGEIIHLRREKTARKPDKKAEDESADISYIAYEDLKDPDFTEREFNLMMEWDEIIAKELGIID